MKKKRELESAKETKPEDPTIDLKDVYKTYGSMIQYLCGICGCDGVPLSYIAQPMSDMMTISEADNPSNAYATHDEEIVKRVPTTKPVHAANATEEDEHFSDTFIRDRGKVCDLIYPLLPITDA